MSLARYEDWTTWGTKRPAGLPPHSALPHMLAHKTRPLPPPLGAWNVPLGSPRCQERPAGTMCSVSPCQLGPGPVTQCPGSKVKMTITAQETLCRKPWDLALNMVFLAQRRGIVQTK